MKTIIALILCAGINIAQPAHQSSQSVGGSAYEIPFPEGTGIENTIELSIANISAIAVNQVKVEAVNIPAGIKFAEKSVTITSIKAKEEQTAVFTFMVDKTAHVDKEQTLSFTITDKTGKQWIKDIKVAIAPPRTYELYQNYPNPFNPTTVISYQLSAISNVNLRIYDVIGREVVNLVNEQQEPGYYQKIFDASRYASGMYVYRLIATDEKNKRHVLQKKMILVK